MPLIEELPTTSTTRASHGWAYVPDTGPAKALLQPGGRKRGVGRDGAANRGDVSAKQQKIVQARLADLEKENYKDTAIPIPARAKEKGRKITPNVRRILTYQRTFAHYLADEEAQISQSGSSNVAPPSATLRRSHSSRGNAPAAAAAPTATRTPSTSQLPMHPPPRPQTPKSTSAALSAPSTLKRERSSSTSRAMAPTPAASDLSSPTTPKPKPTPSSTSVNTAGAPLPTNNLILATDPLLKSHTPKFPSVRVMEALLAEPPLSYNAARAKASDSHAKPRRHFCAICGYWGKVRCRKCGERTCGLMECWRGHEAGCAALY